MCALIKQFGPLTGRALMSLIFIIAGVHKVKTFEAASAYLAAHGLIMPDVILVLIIIIELGGGFFILFGIKARHTAAVIFIYLIPMTLFFHQYWSFTGIERMSHFHHFFKNIAMMGGHDVHHGAWSWATEF
jgi:putative oxidoreductase